MKQWNNPQLLSLGVESTFEEVGTFAGNGNNQDKDHWCHAMNNGAGGKCNIVHNGDYNEDGVTHTSVNASHHHPATGNAVNYNKCCCKDYKQPQS